jgi:cysteine-S-conjugate beta-lyase
MRRSGCATSSILAPESDPVAPSITTPISCGREQHVHRVPELEWIGVRAETHYDRDGVGVSRGTLFDEQGPIAANGATGYALDLDGIDHAMAEGARGLLLCSPHNPVGLIHTREQLVELSQIIHRRGGFVVSDEIHAPLTHHGHEFVPYLSVSEEARGHGIAALSASKAFNLAGLKCAFFVAESESMISLIKSLPEEVTFRAGLFGLMATREGFTHGRDWLDATITSIETNFALLQQQLNEKLPAIRMRRPNASYIAWLDMSALGWGDDPAETALRHAKVALSNGPSFGRPGVGFARMNLACAPETIMEAIDRLARAADRGN